MDPTPDTPAAKHRDRGLGGRGRVVGANEILAGDTVTPAATYAVPTGGLKRSGRVMSIPPDIVDRVTRSGMYRADLLLIAANRYGDQLQHIVRLNIKGRVRFVVSLNDDEHARLLRIAKRRGWSLSATAAALLDLYFIEHEQHTQQERQSGRVPNHDPLGQGRNRRFVEGLGLVGGVPSSGGLWG